MKTSSRIYLTAILLVLPLPATAGDWPQFLGPARDGVSAETGLNLTWDKKGPPTLWEHAAGEGYSGPVVAGNDLILFHRVGAKEVVECLEAATGKPRWKFDYACDYRDGLGKGDGPRATPQITDMRVYTLGADGQMHCLERATGKKVWSRPLVEDYKADLGYFGVGTSPLLAGGLLIVNIGGKGNGVVALDAETGKEVWKATDDDASYSSPIAVTVGGTRHIICFTRDGIVSLDPKTGAVRFKKKWRARIDASVNAATPLFIDGHVFVSASYQTGAGLFKIGKDALETVWSGDNSLSAHYNTPVYRDGFLYGFDGRQDKRETNLRCIDAKTGKVLWTKTDYVCGSMILVDGHLLILTEDGDLVSVEATPKEYREVARASVLNGLCRAQIALADGRLFARDSKKLVCFKLSK